MSTKATKKLIVLLLFRFAILFEILWGAHAWFTWQCDVSRTNRYLALIIVFLTAFVYQKNQRIVLRKSTNTIGALFCYFIGYWLLSRFSLASIVGNVLSIYPIWVLLSDKNNASSHLQFVIKTLSVILVIGIIEYFILQIISIPGPLISYADVKGYEFCNYGFCLIPLHSLGGFSRFSSVFLEPGYMGALLAFLLYAARYDFSKRYIRILLYALLISLSLAGYILCVVGYILYQSDKGFNIGKYIGIAFCLGIVCLFATNYNEGKNFVNEKIIERLQPDNKKGIVGNNRTSDVTEKYFREGFRNGNNLFGLGLTKVKHINGGDNLEDGFRHDNINGTGYQFFIVVHGVVPILFFLLFYINIGSSLCISVRYRRFFVWLVVLTFIQASYPSSPSWIYPIILGLNSYK